MSKKNKIAAFIKERDTDETVKVQDQTTAQGTPNEEGAADDTAQGTEPETTNEPKIGFWKKAAATVKGAVPKVVKFGKKAGKAAYTGLAIYGAVRVIDDVRASKNTQIDDTAPVEEDEPAEEIPVQDVTEDTVEE